jgi:hypothetical protein
MHLFLKINIYSNLTGLIPCSPEAIEYVLSRPQKGAMAAIMPGGIPESRPEFFVSGKYKLFLRRRKVMKF